MNTRYFLYAIVLTIFTTVINWSNAFSTLSGPRHYSSGSSSGGYYGGGGGHK